jgi:hypothetical protein
MNIEMRLAAGKRYPQHTTAFRVGFCRSKLELCAIELVRHNLSQVCIWQKAPGGGRGGAALQEAPSGPNEIPARNRGMVVSHGLLPP